MRGITASRSTISSSEVIPGLWLPLTLLLPWLVPRWRKAWQAGDLRVGLLTSWVVLVVLFFSFSSGKRGVYILPAVPALALASGPYLLELMQRRSVQRAVVRPGRGDRGGLFAGRDLRPDTTGRAPGNHGQLRDRRVRSVAVDRHRRRVDLRVHANRRGGCSPTQGYLPPTLLTVSYWVNPAMNVARSGQAFIKRVEQMDDPTAELGFVGFKEQYLLERASSHRSLRARALARGRARSGGRGVVAERLGAAPVGRQ